MRGQTRKGRWSNRPSVLSVPLLSPRFALCFLSFGLSTLTSCSVSSCSAMSLFFSLISFSCISPLFSILFSLCLSSFYCHLFLLLSVFSILCHSCLSVSLSLSFLSPYPIPTLREWTQGIQKRKWTQGGCTDPDAQGPNKAKHPVLSFNPESSIWSPSSPRP